MAAANARMWLQEAMYKIQMLMQSVVACEMNWSREGKEHLIDVNPNLKHFMTIKYNDFSQVVEFKQSNDCFPVLVFQMVTHFLPLVLSCCAPTLLHKLKLLIFSVAMAMHGSVSL